MSTPLPLDEIPGPRGLPVVGNIFDIDAADPIEGFVRMAGEYGPIFKLATPAGLRLFISGPDLVDEVCDDTRFDKKVTGGLANVDDGSSAGLFTAETQDPLWHRAHNILLTPFSLQAMRDYQPKMLDVADQLLDKWTRLNPGEAVDVPADMTRLTLDTIALCGFGYRFNSFYRDHQHPFVEAMLRTLADSQDRARQLPLQTRLRVRAARQREEDDAFMNDLVDRLIAERRAQGDAADTTDLLGRMLTGWTGRPARACPTTTSGPSASRSWWPGTRPPRGCSRSPPTTCSRTRRCWPGPGPRSTRCWAAAPRPASSRCSG
jgi:cytochrome P450 / NADPH-cytochrome P450 reductase